MTRADLRISSNESGFFFWGMMLLPVVTASESSTKPNRRGVNDQIFASRLRWTMVSDDADTKSTLIIPVADSIQAVPVS